MATIDPVLVDEHLDDRPGDQRLADRLRTLGQELPARAAVLAHRELPGVAHARRPSAQDGLVGGHAAKHVRSPRGTPAAPQASRRHARRRPGTREGPAASAMREDGAHAADCGRGCAGGQAAGVEAGSAARAVSTSEANAASSFTASSASMRRSTSTPAAFRPWMNRL